MIIITDSRTLASALLYLQYLRVCFVPDNLKPSLQVLKEKGFIKSQERHGVEYVYPLKKVAALKEKELRQIIEEALA